MIANLKCWGCGKILRFEIDSNVKFAYEVVCIAEQLGWVGEIDDRTRQALVFCTEKCMEAARDKRGRFRKSPGYAKPLSKDGAGVPQKG